MILQQPASIARVLGLVICVLSTWLTLSETLHILGKAPHIPWWQAAKDFGLLGLLAFSLTVIGEWLWSFEEGWERLQRSLRLIQAVLILGGFACALIIRIEDALHLL